MLQEPVSRTILKMAFPTIVAFLITSVYNFADTYFVSSLGTSATAAVSVNASLDQIIMMAGSMLAIGANSYIARLLGQQNREKASQVLSTAFFIAFKFAFNTAVIPLSVNPSCRIISDTFCLSTESCFPLSSNTHAFITVPPLSNPI